MLRIIFLVITLFYLSGCATPMRMGISDAQWQNYTPEEQARIKTGYYQMLKSRSTEERVIPDGTFVNVKVSGGQILMPPSFSDSCSYSPFELEIPSGDCKTVKVKQDDGNKTVAVQICYHNKSIFVDPSRYDSSKRLGSIQLHYSPIWDRGFTYSNVSSTGYAHLKNVNVAVRRYGNNEPTDSQN